MQRTSQPRKRAIVRGDHCSLSTINDIDFLCLHLGQRFLDAGQGFYVYLIAYRWILDLGTFTLVLARYFDITNVALREQEEAHSNSDSFRMPMVVD